MENLRRLIPFVRPYRGRLLISIVFGLVVASLWGGNLMAVYPVVQILMEQKPLEQYVAEEIEKAESEIERRTGNLERSDERIRLLQAENRPTDDAEIVEELAIRVENEQKLSTATGRLLTMKQVQITVLPWVPSDKFQAFALIMGLLLVANLIKGVFCFLQDILVGGVVQRVVMSLRMRALDKVLSLDYQSLSRDGTGGLMSRFTYDTEQVAMGMSLIGARLVREPLKCLSCLTLALWLNWRLTLLSFVFIPVFGIFFHWYGESLKRASRRMMESMSRIYKSLEETMEGLKVIIAFGSASHHHRQFRDENNRFYERAMRLVRVDAIAKPTTEVLGLLAMFIAVLPGAYLVLRQQTDILGVRLAANVLTAKDLCALYALLVGMLDPCRKMSNVFTRLKRCSAALERIFGLLDRKPDVKEIDQPRPLVRHRESIEFRDVTFQYPAREDIDQRGPALQDVSIKVRAGEVVALVGRNGCGKSTLLNLLPRLYDPTQGEILIDGVPIREVSFADLRRQIGLVTQDTILFDDSIYENIRYGNPSATREEIENAARKARVMEIVEHVPHGFENGVGERGRDLSGGQRQRIALARAIVRDPSILILDEATSAADAHSEAMIHEALLSFSKGRTVFIITHSMTPSLLKLIDRIVVMDAGQIIASGIHEDLLQSCSMYDTLYHAKSTSRAA